MSNVGKWDRWYFGLNDSEPYGDTESYRMGANWLADCDDIEDWGCGKGWFKNFVGDEQTYIGVDGSRTPFANVLADLVTYTSSTEGLFMRHVLEHNYDWMQILTNAVDSFTKRMVLVLFTPLEDMTREIAFADDPGVPDLALSKPALEHLIDCGGANVAWAGAFPSKTQYEWETIYLLEKR